MIYSVIYIIMIYRSLFLFFFATWYLLFRCWLQVFASWDAALFQICRHLSKSRFVIGQFNQYFVLLVTTCQLS